MNTILFILFWLASSAIGYKLTQYWWTSSFDWTGTEVILVTFISVFLGPLSIIVGLTLILTNLLSNLSFTSKVIKPRRIK